MILVCPDCSSRFKVKPTALGDSGRTVRCAKCGNKWHASQEDLIDPDDLKSLSDAAQTPKKGPAKKAAKKKAKAKPPPPPVEEDDGAQDDVDPYDQADDHDDHDGMPPPPPPMLDGTEPPPIPSEADFNPHLKVPTRRKSPLVAWIVLFAIVLVGSAGAFFFRESIVVAYPPTNKVFHMVGFPVDMLGHGLEITEPVAEAVIEADKRRLVIKGTIENKTDETIIIPKLAGSLLDGTGAVMEEWVFESEKPEAFPGESIVYQTVFESPPRGATSILITFKTDEEASMLMGGHDDDGHMMKDDHVDEGQMKDDHGDDGHMKDDHSDDGHSANHN